MISVHDENWVGHIEIGILEIHDSVPTTAKSEHNATTFFISELKFFDKFFPIKDFDDCFLP